MLKKKIVKFESGKIGSALIMTVVLTVLLSIVAVMFVMVARMDSASTSNIVNSKTLDNAARSIIEIIGKELVFDTPGVALNAGLPNTPETLKYFEYQDYPDVNDAWLANIEPYDAGATYYEWRQISDVTGYLKSRGFARQDVSVKPTGSNVVKEYPEIKTTDGKLNDLVADADGDGIADSKWIELADMRSPKGKPVYAAVRVIDNCAMLNVNTAYMFDANSSNSSDRYKVDGTSQMQINLKGLLKTGDDIEKFHKARSGGIAADSETSWNNYDNQVIWKYDSVPGGSYLPFDISDELELRYRYCIDSRFAGRIETDVNAMPKTVRGADTDDFGTFYNSDGGWGLNEWQDRIAGTDRTVSDSDRRHLLTTYNFDRLIDPNGNKMFDVRFGGGDAQGLYNKLTGCIDQDHSGGKTPNQMHAYLAQFAANVADRGDNDSNVSIVKDEYNREFYGDEQPYIYISEIARNFQQSLDPCDANIYRSYAIELFREFETPDGNDIFKPWRLEITDSNMSPIYIDSNNFQSRGGQFYVIIFEDANNPSASLSDKVKFVDSPANGAKGVDPTVTLSWNPFFMGFDPNDNPIWSSAYDFYYGTNEDSVKNANETNPIGGEYALRLAPFYPSPPFADSTKYFWRVVGKKVIDGNEVKVNGPVWSFTTWDTEPNSVYEKGRFLFGANTVIRLYRPMETGPKLYILVDETPMLPSWLTDNTSSDGTRSFKRDISWGNRLKHIWDLSNCLMIDCSDKDFWRLGNSVNYDSGVANPIQPWHHYFTTVGDAAMAFAKKDIYFEGSVIVPSDTEVDVRFDIDNPSMQNVFKYITALRSPHDANETRVRGRININTAPKFVIEQLPWVSKANRKDLKIADAIVAYRDKLNLSPEGGPDYYHNRATDARKQETDIAGIYEAPSFRSVGELLNVINQSGKNDYNIRYCGIANGQQYGYPDLTFDSMSMTDGAVDDLEEKELIFARISDLATVRSDTFTAYILVRVGVDGPQKRFIAILDRTDVKTKDDKVKVAAFQQVPAAR